LSEGAAVAPEYPRGRFRCAELFRKVKQAATPVNKIGKWIK
jgi:hypothetical protein